MKLITIVTDHNTTYTMYFTGDHYLTKYFVDGKYIYRLCRHDNSHTFHNLTEKQYNDILKLLKGAK
jgi:hypothetical protein